VRVNHLGIYTGYLGVDKSSTGLWLGLRRGAFTYVGKKCAILDGNLASKLSI